jgi:hypothetical protein
MYLVGKYDFKEKELSCAASAAKSRFSKKNQEGRVMETFGFGAIKKPKIS